jgi:pimeloyl-ACP methyl ester carboxylesterase
LAAPDLPPRHKLQTRCGALEYIVSGAGRPVIVLFNGAGVALEGWQGLYPRIEGLGAVLAWNRFGVEGSDAPRPLQSGALVVASVRELLAYAGLAPPYVLVGHSIGGLYANLFARLYPDDVAGVLFLEATHPRDHEVLQMDEAHLTRALVKVLSLPQWLFKDNLRSEIESVGHIVREVEAAGAFPPVPIAVVTGGSPPPKWLMPPEAWQARLANQQQLARLSPRSTHVIATHSGHFPQLSEADLVVGTLERLVRIASEEPARPTAASPAGGMLRGHPA